MVKDPRLRIVRVVQLSSLPRRRYCCFSSEISLNRWHIYLQFAKFPIRFVYRSELYQIVVKDPRLLLLIQPTTYTRARRDLRKR